jgi:ABC-2 type transport system ATP-binding protein
MRTALRIDNLTVGYPTGLFQPHRPVVKGISFSVFQGETVGFLGPNGAGKSSTIKAIMGFVRPSSGTITVFDHPAGSTPAKQRVGYLPEVALYYPFLTAVEALDLYGKLQRMNRADRQREAQTLLHRVGLAGSEHRQLRTFSKGMQQRLGIAQALLGHPDFLVLDEVTSGLDPIGRRELRDLLEEIKRSGTTIFFSSHELNEVAQLCDRVILLNNGTIVAEQTMDKALQHTARTPLEDYFIEAISTNVTVKGAAQ